MKKLMLSMLATAAMAAGGAAYAQSAECGAGTAWGPIPGCGDPTAPPANAQVWPGQHGPYFDPRIGYYDPRVYVPSPRSAYPYGPDAYGPNVVRPTRRDRDGDGVRNRDDRYPDDPRRY